MNEMKKKKKTAFIIYFHNYGPCIKSLQIGYVKEDLQIWFKNKFGPRKETLFIPNWILPLAQNFYFTYNE